MCILYRYEDGQVGDANINTQEARVQREILRVIGTQSSWMLYLTLWETKNKPCSGLLSSLWSLLPNYNVIVMKETFYIFYKIVF